MIVYLIIDFVMLLFAIVMYYDKYRYNIRNNKIFLVIIGFIIIFISGFRGNFTADYDNYVNLFNYYNNFNFNQIFSNNFGQEIGYVILNKIIGFFTKNSIYIILIMSILTIYLFLKEFKRYSVNIWLSVLLFITIGAYYTSFNLIRQILAVAIIFSGSKYIYKKNFIKYFIYILTASLIHKTALIMIIFYFILNSRFSIKKLIIILISLIFCINYLDLIIIFIQKYFYSYYTYGKYGMTGFNYKNIVLPISILIFVLIHYYKLDLDNNRINVWINAIIFYAFFSLLGLKIQMVQRVADFFAPYALLIIPLIISKIKDKKIRAIYIFLIVSLSILYNFIVLYGSGYETYHFIWQCS
ncbi:EpsG family protein [Clostridium perfringens]|uniref:EpsG family protein n=1 Tax=Clostridium perfringens TaxID=1502 RepID=UPI0023F8E108|nr:EpsG family protein [Clostridium perfringens]WEV22673.1 EpsG family protein [Clostridium perfringens D]